MYARKVTFTLLAPSIWPVIEAVGKTHIGDDYRRYLMKTNSNSGLLMEVFASRQSASQKLEVLRALQGLHEQAMAKVAISEGELI